MSELLTRCSIESSLETVQELHGSQENDGIRAQLRERDELAIRLLHTPVSYTHLTLPTSGPV